MFDYLLADTEMGKCHTPLHVVTFAKCKLNFGNADQAESPSVLHTNVDAGSLNFGPVRCKIQIERFTLRENIADIVFQCRSYALYLVEHAKNSKKRFQSNKKLCFERLGASINPLYTFTPVPTLDW